jgi:hypothetical protein
MAQYNSNKKTGKPKAVSLCTEPAAAGFSFFESEVEQ